jgi:osmotically-inducible protein OsmY
MPSAIGILTVVIALIGAVPPRAHAASQAAGSQADQTLSAAIDSRFDKDQALKDYDIKVAVEAGVATLRGTVRTDMQKTRAGELAEAAGARQVVNQIVVDSAAAPRGMAGTLEETDEAIDRTEDAADKTEDAAERAWEKTKDGWEVVVDRTADIAKRAGAEITDAWITTSITTRIIGEDALDDSDIDVDTDRHVVTLSGTVPTDAARDKAIDIAKDTDGVDRIVDKLVVGAKK